MKLALSKEYNKYMHSKKWQELRQEVFARDGSHCVLCGSYKRIQCHHNDYRHFGNERLDELTTLCASCHFVVTWMLRARRMWKKVKSVFLKLRG